MKTYNVTFAGHREVYDFRAVEDELDKIITDLLKTKAFVDFYVGNDGEFDIMATSAIRAVRRDMGEENSTLNLVLPYRKANMDMFEESFDSVFVPNEIIGCHPKGAITARNKWLVENCDMIICYVTHSGGADATMKYAKKCGKSVINLFEIIYS